MPLKLKARNGCPSTGIFQGNVMPMRLVILNLILRQAAINITNNGCTSNPSFENATRGPE